MLKSDTPADRNIEQAEFCVHWPCVCAFDSGPTAAAALGTASQGQADGLEHEQKSFEHSACWAQANGRLYRCRNVFCKENNALSWKNRLRG